MGWKIYFWILFATMIPTYMWQGFSRSWEIIDCIMSTIAMFGLFAFSYKKRIFNILFWRAYLLISIIWNTYYQYFLPFPKKVAAVNFGGLSHSMIATINLIFFIPLYIALFLYAFKRTELWKNSA